MFLFVTGVQYPLPGVCKFCTHPKQIFFNCSSKDPNTYLLTMRLLLPPNCHETSFFFDLRYSAVNKAPRVGIENKTLIIVTYLTYMNNFQSSPLTFSSLSLQYFVGKWENTVFLLC